MVRAFAVLIVACVAWAHPQEQLDQAAVGLSRSALTTLLKEAGLPALQVAVWQDGRVVWSEAFGYANVETRTPATTTTKFRIASISKSMTGTLLARMAADGRIDLDAPVRRYIEDYPDVGAEITARQLASHTAGIRHYRGNEISSTVAYPTTRSALAIFAADDLLFEPGEKYDYTTYGFTLLGALMEAAGGATFYELLLEDVLAPLEMTHTVVDDPRALIEERASSYELINGRLVNARPTDHSYKIPGGGMLSTAEDLVRLGAAVMAPGELNETEIELLHTSSQLSSGRDVGYSLGWSVGGGDVPSRISHTGSQPGSHCLLYARPRQEIVVAVLCNSRGAPFGATLAEIITDHFEAGNGEGPAIDPTGVYEIVPAEGDPVRVDVWRQADHYRAMVTFGAERMPLMSVQVVENRIVAHAFDGRLVELEMTLTGDEVEAVLRRGGTTRASGRRVSSEAFSVRGDH